MSEQGQQAPERQFAMQRIYMKDASFESPRSPEAFLGEFKPQINLDLNTRHSSIGEEVYEVVLSLTVTAKNEAGDALYLAEVQQGGIFAMRGLEPDALAHTLGSFCPSVLFPYAREAIDAMVIKGSFPALMLAPVNFDMLYEQARKQKEAAEHVN